MQYPLDPDEKERSWKLEASVLPRKGKEVARQGYIEGIEYDSWKRLL
jgi:hypothetical protein